MYSNRKFIFALAPILIGLFLAALYIWPSKSINSSQTSSAKPSEVRFSNFPLPLATAAVSVASESDDLPETKQISSVIDAPYDDDVASSDIPDELELSRSHTDDLENTRSTGLAQNSHQKDSKPKTKSAALLRELHNKHPAIRPHDERRVIHRREKIPRRQFGEGRDIEDERARIAVGDETAYIWLGKSLSRELFFYQSEWKTPEWQAMFQESNELLIKALRAGVPNVAYDIARNYSLIRTESGREETIIWFFVTELTDSSNMPTDRFLEIVSSATKQELAEGYEGAKFYMDHYGIKPYALIRRRQERSNN